MTLIMTPRACKSEAEAQPRPSAERPPLEEGARGRSGAPFRAGGKTKLQGRKLAEAKTLMQGHSKPGTNSRALWRGSGVCVCVCVCVCAVGEHWGMDREQQIWPLSLTQPPDPSLSD